VPPLLADTNVAFVGSVSRTTTLAAADGPLLVTSRCSRVRGRDDGRRTDLGDREIRALVHRRGDAAVGIGTVVVPGVGIGGSTMSRRRRSAASRSSAPSR